MAAKCGFWSLCNDIVCQVRHPARRTINEGSGSMNICGIKKDICKVRLIVVPYIISLDECSMRSFSPVENHSAIKGKFPKQFEYFRMSLNADFKLWWNCSNVSIVSEL